MSTAKHPFTDERIGSLLADVVKWKLDTGSTSFQQDGDYQCRIDFTVKDEHIIINDNDIFKLKKQFPNMPRQPVLSKAEADIICDKILQQFYDSDSMDPSGVNMARHVIQSFIVKKPYV